MTNSRTSSTSDQTTSRFSNFLRKCSSRSLRSSAREDRPSTRNGWSSTANNSPTDFSFEGSENMTIERHEKVSLVATTFDWGKAHWNGIPLVSGKDWTYVGTADFQAPFHDTKLFKPKTTIPERVQQMARRLDDQHISLRLTITVFFNPTDKMQTVLRNHVTDENNETSRHEITFCPNTPWMEVVMEKTLELDDESLGHGHPSTFSFPDAEGTVALETSRQSTAEAIHHMSVPVSLEFSFTPLPSERMGSISESTRVG